MSENFAHPSKQGIEDVVIPMLGSLFIEEHVAVTLTADEVSTLNARLAELAEKIRVLIAITTPAPTAEQVEGRRRDGVQALFDSVERMKKRVAIVEQRLAPKPTA